MQLVIKKFDELSTTELYKILQLRVDVFVVEQNCPYPELDDKDQNAYHIYLQEKDEIQAYLRVLAPGVSFEEASIGRVIAKKRRCGLGSKILAEAIKLAEEVFETDIRIEAQTYAVPFYKNFDFIVVSEEFLEDGIPHVQMLHKKSL